MRTLGAWVVALGIAPGAFAAPGYAYVPASLETHVLGFLSIPEAPSEHEIVFVGTPKAPPPAIAPRRVFAFGIAAHAERDAEPNAAPKPERSGVPSRAQWPDAGGHIVVADPRGSDPAGEGGANPWVSRERTRHAPHSLTFTCGGIIIGGDLGPIALVNGRIVKRGDTLGSFSVAGVSREGAVLEWGGSLYVIPMGRVTTVTLPES
jgi:hypothetical protein